MKSLTLLWSKLANELASWCCTSATFDSKRVELRVKHEGISFLMITLPDFAKDFERSLELSQVDRRLFSSFKKRGELPLFLGGFLDLVFDRGSGVLLDDPSIEAIHAIRQLTLLFSKVAVPCSDARYRKSMAGYVQCEKDVEESSRNLSSRNIRDFDRVCSLLFSSAFSNIDREIYAGNHIPKHGPGATADSLRGNGKFQQFTWPARLEEMFPARDNIIPNLRFNPEMEAVNILEPGAEIPVKVISVPKTLKTPRIIGIEPTAMQYAQQAILPEILAAIKRDNLLNSCLGFDDQTPNQEYARLGSLSGYLATLDLSEASDRVSNQLVRVLMARHPWFSKSVQACRSQNADVPGHGIIPLTKFASMGSALTFPVEAMVFLAIVTVGMERDLNTHFDRKDMIKYLSGQVRIYGDDIIVPVRYVRSVIETLEAFGLLVNRRKSFWNGKFRESCGKDYYAGSDVSVVRLRHLVPSSPRHAQEVISLVSFRNQLYFAGYWDTCKWLDRKIGKILKYFPVVLPTSPALGRHSFLGYSSEKTHATLHKPMVKAYGVHAVSPRDPLDESGALLKFFLRKERILRFREVLSEIEDSPSQEGHLERAGRPQTVNIKLRWYPAI